MISMLRSPGTGSTGVVRFAISSCIEYWKFDGVGGRMTRLLELGFRMMVELMVREGAQNCVKMKRKSLLFPALGEESSE